MSAQLRKSPKTRFESKLRVAAYSFAACCVSFTQKVVHLSSIVFILNLELFYRESLCGRNHHDEVGLHTNDIQGTLAEGLSHGIKEDKDKLNLFSCIGTLMGSVGRWYLLTLDDVGTKSNDNADPPNSRIAFSMSNEYFISPSTKPGVSIKVACN